MIQRGFNRFGRNTPKKTFPAPAETKVQQHFKEDCDVHNKLRLAQLGNLGLLEERKGFFADLSEMEIHAGSAYEFVDKVNFLFGNLPSGMRRQFGDDPDQFAEWMRGKSAEEIQQYIGVKVMQEKENVTQSNENLGEQSQVPAVPEFLS